MRVYIGNKLHAEKNNPNTCKTSHNLTVGKIMITSGDYEIEPYDLNTKGIIITDSKGNASFLPSIPNKVLGTNAQGKLDWLERRST